MMLITSIVIVVVVGGGGGSSSSSSMRRRRVFFSSTTMAHFTSHTKFPVITHFSTSDTMRTQGATATATAALHQPPAT